MKTISRFALAAALSLGLGASTLRADTAAPAGGATVAATAVPAATPAPTKAKTKHKRHPKGKGHKHQAKMNESTGASAVTGTASTDKK